MKTEYVDRHEPPAEKVLSEIIAATPGKDRKATAILEWAQYWYHTRGYDALWIYGNAEASLTDIGLSANDFQHFERRLARVVGVNE